MQMNTASIYDNMLNKCYNVVKGIRDNRTYGISREKDLSTLIDIGGYHYRTYNKIVDDCIATILEMIPWLIMALMKEYNICFNLHGVRRSESFIYSLDGVNDWEEPFKQIKESKVFFGFCSNDDRHNGCLYIFGEYEMASWLPDSLLKQLMDYYKQTDYCYVFIIDKEALPLTADSSHTDSGNDTHICSLKDFFDSFFGIDEYNSFKKFANRLTALINDYLGFEVVQTLRPNTINGFFNTVRYWLYNYDLQKSIIPAKITDSQRSVLLENFRRDNNCELLIGSADYAKSFITSEWLFYSLTGAEQIDLTSIAMGYFKSVEQFLFCFIKLHTKEKDGLSRSIYVGGKNQYADEKGLAELTDQLLADNQMIEKITLSSLTGFFGFYDNNMRQYRYRNKDLLREEILDDTYKCIIDFLNDITELRNGYFHKENLLEWDIVKKARDYAYQVYILFLGAYKISENDRYSLGLIKEQDHDDYHMLCEYLDNRARVYFEKTDSCFGIPIFYFSCDAHPVLFYYAYRDNYIKYDDRGNKTYSGLYFYKETLPDEPIRPFKIDRNNLPMELWEGELDYFIDDGLTLKPTGPRKKIFANGKFFK